jgi:hypothetical protein
LAKNYQIAIKLPNCKKLATFSLQGIKNVPKLGFFESVSSGNPATIFKIRFARKTAASFFCHQLYFKICIAGISTKT